MAITKIIVLYGGQSSEREVSLESGKFISQSLENLGYEVQLIDYPQQFSFQQLTQEDFIFIALHGEDGESGELQKLLQQRGIVNFFCNFQLPHPFRRRVNQSRRLV